MMGGERSWGYGVFVGACVVVLAACGGAPPPSAPSPATEDRKPEPKPEPAPAPEEADEPKAAPEPVVEPEFRPGMSVAEAVAAVPPDLPRLNIEPEALAAPISDPELYAPCQLKASEHFRVEVAIWNGRAVGIDVELKPKNDSHAECVRKIVENVQWRDRARSLNTVRFQL